MSEEIDETQTENQNEGYDRNNGDMDTNMDANEITNELGDQRKFMDFHRLSKLWEIMDTKEQNRYEKFKRSGLEKRKKSRSTHKVECPRIKKIVQNILGENVPVSSLIQNALHGLAKVYAGELVEEAKLILIEENGYKDSYPSIKPRHLREARRRMIQRGKLPSLTNTKKYI